MAMTGMFRRNGLPVAVFVAAMGFGAMQAFASATDRPGKEQRGYCDDLWPCMSACGEAGGTYYGTMPDGGPLCDCCAPE